MATIDEFKNCIYFKVRWLTGLTIQEQHETHADSRQVVNAGSDSVALTLDLDVEFKGVNGTILVGFMV